MRVVKFRAWNGNKFINDYYNHNHFISISDGKLIQVQHDDVCHEGVVYGKPETVTLQQFTGLLDKNGVEIYEGDIVLLNDHFVSAVEFSGCSFVVKTKSIYANRGIDVNPPSEYETVEVIGNIHKNPELLK